jgi:hypothetical protein
LYLVVNSKVEGLAPGARQSYHRCELQRQRYKNLQHYDQPSVSTTYTDGFVAANLEVGSRIGSVILMGFEMFRQKIRASVAYDSLNFY